MARWQISGRYCDIEGPRNLSLMSMRSTLKAWIMMDEDSPSSSGGMGAAATDWKVFWGSLRQDSRSLSSLSLSRLAPERLRHTSARRMYLKAYGTPALRRVKRVFWVRMMEGSRCPSTQPDSSPNTAGAGLDISADAYSSIPSAARSIMPVCWGSNSDLARVSPINCSWAMVSSLRGIKCLEMVPSSSDAFLLVVHAKVLSS